MNEKLSALMDGELDRREAIAAIKTLGQDVQQRGDWDCYHLIGDALRGDSPSVTARRKACAESIFAKLAAEPTILAPAATSASAKLNAVTKPAVIEKKTRMVLAMAASVVTVTAIGVIALRQQNGNVVPLQVAEQTRQALIPAISASCRVPGRTLCRRSCTFSPTNIPRQQEQHDEGHYFGGRFRHQASSRNSGRQQAVVANL